MRNNKYKEYDQHIISALKLLPIPLKTFDGHNVFFDENKRFETIYEHISNKKHHLHLKDIAEIPKILLSEDSLREDRSGKRFRTYIGRRSKSNERLKYLKIITKLKKKNNETVITIHTVKNNN